MKKKITLKSGSILTAIILSTLLSCVPKSGSNSSSLKVHFPDGSSPSEIAALRGYEALTTGDNYALPSISAWADISCYAVLVKNPAKKSLGSCYDNTSTVISRPSEIMGFVQEGSSIEVAVDPGPNQTIQIVALKSAVNCFGFQNFDSSLYPNTSAPMVVSEITTDLKIGVNEVNMIGTIDANKEMKSCTFVKEPISGTSITQADLDPATNEIVIYGSFTATSNKVKINGQELKINSESTNTIRIPFSSTARLMFMGLANLTVENAIGAATYNASNLTFQGNHDSSDNQVSAASPSLGDYYVINVAGNYDPDAVIRSNTYAVGDWAVFNGTDWDQVSLGASGTTVTSVNSLDGNVTIDLADLPSVDTTGVTLDSILKFDGTNWVIGTDETGSFTDTNTNSTTECTGTDILAADGDCYPQAGAPGVGSIGTAEIADATITNADISPTAAIAQSKISNLTTELATMNSNISAKFDLTNSLGGSVNNILYWDGDSWAPTDIISLIPPPPATAFDGSGYNMLGSNINMAFYGINDVSALNNTSGTLALTSSNDLSLDTTGSGNIILNTSTGSVGVGTASPNFNAALHVDSTTKGFMPPRLTNTQRATLTSTLSASDRGMIIFNLSNSTLQYFDGLNWTPLTSNILSTRINMGSGSGQTLTGPSAASYSPLFVQQISLGPNDHMGTNGPQIGANGEVNFPVPGIYEVTFTFETTTSGLTGVYLKRDGIDLGIKPIPAQPGVTTSIKDVVHITSGNQVVSYSGKSVAGTINLGNFRYLIKKID